MTTNQTHDVVVIGGGAAGLSGAIQLARQRRSVLVVDNGQPRNAPAAAMHGFLGHDGLRPTSLLEIGRQELAGYGGAVRHGTVRRVERTANGGFTVHTEGDQISARRLLVATGVADQLPQVTGLAAHWGEAVVHCPYCHGWEVRDQAIAVIGGAASGIHQAMLFGQLTDQLTFISHDAELTADQRADLAARGATLIQGRAHSVVEDDAGTLVGIQLESGQVIPATVAVVATTMQARTDFLTGLGIEAQPHPSGMGAQLAAANQGQLAPGIWAAGNVSAMTAQVMAAAADGAMAGALINADLVAEDVAAARAAT